MNAAGTNTLTGRGFLADSDLLDSASGHSLNRTDNGSGAGEGSLREAIKPRAVRKVEARSPERRSSESCHQARRRDSQAGAQSEGSAPRVTNIARARNAPETGRWAGQGKASYALCSGSHQGSFTRQDTASSARLTLKQPLNSLFPKIGPKFRASILRPRSA